MNFGISLTRVSLLVFTGVCLLFTSVIADVVSTSGNIDFKLQDSGANVMRLDSTGLGIGPDLTPSANLHVEGNAIISRNLTIGTTTMGSVNLSINGLISFDPQSVSTNISNLTSSVVLCDTSSGNISLTLPKASTVEGRIYRIKKTSTSNDLNIVSYSDNIDTENYINFPASASEYSHLEVLSASGNWHILSISEGGNLFTKWHPGMTGAVVTWYDADDFDSISISGGKVSEWKDKLWVNHASQSVASQRPSYQASDPYHNNMPTIGDEDTNTGQIGIETPSITVKTVYIIMDYKDGLDANFDLGLQTFLYGASDKARIMGSGTDFYGTINSGVFYNGGGAYRNGSSSSNLTGVLPMPSTLYKVKSGASVTKLFNIGYDPGRTRDWQGSYGEIIFTDGTESPDEEEKIEGYLAHKWGLEGLLPGGHAYKTTAP